MARTRIGVDVGSTAVRVAEVAAGDIPVVVRAAQVPLPPGVVEAGEVRQPEALAEALRELWSVSGVTSKQVYLGVGNQRVVVREVALPWLPEKELRDTLGFQVQEFIPMASDEAVLDFDLVGEMPLLLLAYLFVLKPDGGEDLASPSGPTGITGSTGVPAESPSVTPSPTPRETLPPVSLAGSRDPFSIPPGLRSTGGSVSPTTTTTAAATTTFSPPPTTSTFTTPPTTTTQTTTIPPGGDGGGQPGNKILIGVAGSGKELDVQVDAKVYTVEPGATFDDNFKLVKIDGTCARFLFGDQSFELCEK